jgi:AcrR family transcriptional regulator
VGDADEDDDLWAPFLAYRPGDRRAGRLRVHAREDAKRGQQHPPRRATALSRAEIVRAAVAVADAEGPEAISMRRIARELNAGTMSLYWHIGSKDELLDLMTDAIYGEIPAPEPGVDWRGHLHALACSVRATLHRHMWAAQFMSGRPPTGPKSLRLLETSLGAMDDLGLDISTMMTVLIAVNTYVLGAVLREHQEQNGARNLAEQFGHLSEAEKKAVLAEFVAGVRRSGRYPHLIAMMDEGIDPDAPESMDDRFEFGLGCLLDGIAARVTR